jgi:hypothetical protein
MLRVGEEKLFQVFASDADGDPLVYTWTLDAGPLAAASASRLLWSSAAIGTFLLGVTVQDSHGATVTHAWQILVQRSDDGNGGGGGGGAGGDSDPEAFVIKKLRGWIRFDRSSGDGFQLSGVLPNLPAGFNPEGVAFQVDAGGASAEFNLDSRGRAKAGKSSITMSIKAKRDRATGERNFAGGDVAFKANIRNEDLAIAWTDEGMRREVDAKRIPVTLAVSISLSNKRYVQAADVLYSARANKNGTFK